MLWLLRIWEFNVKSFFVTMTVWLSEPDCIWFKSVNLTEFSIESLGEEKGNAVFLKWYVRTEEIMAWASLDRKGSWSRLDLYSNIGQVERIWGYVLPTLVKAKVTLLVCLDLQLLWTGIIPWKSVELYQCIWPLMFQVTGSLNA